MAPKWNWGCGGAEKASSARARQLDAIGWGAFFIWVGIAALANVGIGVGLVGVGLLTLGVQLLRRANALPLEGFWIVVGALFLLGGIWQVFNVQVALMPLLLIAAGLLLVLAAFKPTKTGGVGGPTEHHA